MSRNSPSRKNEKASMSDILGIVLNKGDGTIITNEPQTITEDFLRQLVEKNERRQS